MLKTKKSIMSVIMAVLTSIMLFFVVTPAPVSASAATSSRSKTSMITVVTKANWWVPGSSSITLKQEKKKIAGGNAYGEWIIEVQEMKSVRGIMVPVNTRKITWKDASEKITLKANKTYWISVKWSNTDKNSIANRYWWVGSTWKVSKCY